MLLKEVSLGAFLTENQMIVTEFSLTQKNHHDID